MAQDSLSAIKTLQILIVPEILGNLTLSIFYYCFHEFYLLCKNLKS